MSAQQDKHDHAEEALRKAGAWVDPSLGPPSGKTYTAMLERREAIAAHVAAGGEQPRNLDDAEVKRAREQREAKAAFVPRCMRGLPTSQRAEDVAERAESVPAVWTLADIRDPSGERLRVEEDRRDGRAYITIGEPSEEHPFELLPGARGHVYEAIGVLPCGHEPDPAKPVKQASPAVKTGMANECPKSAALSAHLDAVGPLDVEDLRTLTWIAKRLPLGTLKATCRAWDDERREPALLPDGSPPPNRLTCDGRDHERSTHAAVLGALKDVRRLILPHDVATCLCAPCTRQRTGT